MSKQKPMVAAPVARPSGRTSAAYALITAARQTQPQPWLQPKLAKALRVSADHIEALLAADGVLASPPGRAAAVPRQLPPAAVDFTGRAVELQALTRMLEQAEAGAPTPNRSAPSSPAPGLSNGAGTGCTT